MSGPVVRVNNGKYRFSILHGALVDDREHPSEWAVPSEPRKP